MKLGSKFFTPMLTPRDRELFLHCLGMDELRLFFLESTGQFVLRSLEIRGSVSIPRLEPANTGEVSSLSPLVWLRDPPSHLKLQPAQPTRSLWEELFPYPLSLFPLALHPDTNESLEIRPTELASTLHELWTVLQGTEAKMSAAELSLLRLRRDSAELPLLFHFVRGRRVRLGASPEFAASSQDVSALRATVGTQVQVFELRYESLAAPACDATAVVRRAADLLRNSLKLPVISGSAAGARHPAAGDLQL